jgi:two-component system chemotaxis response regulator CheY
MAVDILVVDDSGVMRAMVIKTLKLAGTPLGEIYQAANGQEGLDVLGDHWVDLVFADINMPVMNGEEMIDRIRDDPAWKDLPIVVISTEGSETRIESLHNKGAEFVHKPFTPEIIRNVLETMLGIDHGQHA